MARYILDQFLHPHQTHEKHKQSKGTEKLIEVNELCFSWPLISFQL